MCETFNERMSTLTEREKQICKIVKDKPGLPIKLIGREIGVSRAMAKSHLENTYKKLNASNRYELVAILCREAIP